MQTEERQEERRRLEQRRKEYYAFAPGMLLGAGVGLLLGLALAFALWSGWFPNALVGQFFGSGPVPALIAAGGAGLALGALLGAVAGWARTGPSS